MEDIFKTIGENIKRVKDSISESCLKAGRDEKDVRLMAVSKTQPAEKLLAAYNAGITLFGENRVQELLQKSGFFFENRVPCHLIGRLQTNKVKYLPALTDTIQSVDSLKLACEISRQYKKAEKTADILLEINVGGEETKSGLPAEEAFDAVCRIATLDGLYIRGLMCIPPICEGDLVRKYFAEMYRLFSDISSSGIPNTDIDVLSMGMSEDYPYAIAEGSTLVRVGRGIFGERIYGAAK